MKQYLEIGKIVGTHGLKGEMRVELWCDSGEFFSKFKTLYLDEGEKKVMVKSRPHKNIAIMKMDSVDTIEQADTLRGKILYMDRNDANLPKGSFFVQDLIGLKVLDIETDDYYGVISDVLRTGANDVYEIKDEDETFYIPKIDDVVKEINTDEGYIRIFPMKGLFDNED